MSPNQSHQLYSVILYAPVAGEHCKRHHIHYNTHLNTNTDKDEKGRASFSSRSSVDESSHHFLIMSYENTRRNQTSSQKKNHQHNETTPEFTFLKHFSGANFGHKTETLSSTDQLVYDRRSGPEILNENSNEGGKGRNTSGYDKADVEYIY